MFNLLKKNKYIVKAYESVFGPLHWMGYKIRNIKLPSLEKTHFSYGNLNKDKKFYVIKYNRPECGIYSMIFHLIPQMEYALHRKYTPIIDCRETYLYMIQDEENAGKENAWDYYFEQPAGFYSLDEVYQSKHVIYVRKNAFGIKKSISYLDTPMPDKDLHYWGALFNQCLRPNAVIRDRIEKEKEGFPKDGRILGISIRAGYRWGGLMKDALYYQHPRVPDCDTFILEISRILEKWNYSSFFLSCDDREYSDRIARRFGNQCIRMDRPLLHFFENDRTVIPVEERLIEFQDYTTQKRTEDYIVETYLLSQCESLYACNGSGVQFAYIVNDGKYKNLKIYDEGLWTKEDLSLS